MQVVRSRSLIATLSLLDVALEECLCEEPELARVLFRNLKGLLVFLAPFLDEQFPLSKALLEIL